VHVSSWHEVEVPSLSDDPARVTLSAIGNRNAQLSRKSHAFEREYSSSSRAKGFQAKTFKFKIEREEFQYDVVDVRSGGGPDAICPI
jgi:hypothetical protein